jgi:hypothetical protein
VLLHPVGVDQALVVRVGQDRLQQGFLRPLLDGLGSFLESAREEVTHVGLRARLGPAGDVAIRGKALFKEGGSFARGAAKVKAAAGGPLARVPAGRYAVTFGGPTLPELMKAMTDLDVQLVRPPPPTPTRTSSARWRRRTSR